MTRTTLIAAGLLALAACDSGEQNAREAAAAREDAVVAAQTGQQYEGAGPREQAADRLEEAYVPSPEAVASSSNSPVKADLPAEVPPVPKSGDKDPATVATD